MRFEKSDFDASRACFEDVVGDVGNGGREVKPGEEGEAGDLGRCEAEEGAVAGEVERLPSRSLCVLCPINADFEAPLRPAVAVSTDILGSFIPSPPSMPIELGCDSVGPGKVNDNRAPFDFTMLFTSVQPSGQVSLSCGHFKLHQTRPLQLPFPYLTFNLLSPK